MHVLFMNSNGSVKNFVKIASATNGGPTLANFDFLGGSVASLGDLDGDGVTDLAVGATGDDTGGTSRGAVHVLFLKPIAPPGIPGDFDEDGDVDGRDFLAWQRGQSATPLSAGDLTDWQDHYGESEELSAISSPLSAFSEAGEEEEFNSLPESFWISSPQVFEKISVDVDTDTTELYSNVSELVAADKAFADLDILPRNTRLDFGDIAVRRAAPSRNANLSLELVNVFSSE
jgi:hypothetical protein